MSALHKTYRPQTWDDVLGQDAIVKALRSAVEGNASQCFMLSGPSGVGKTTLSRIAAHELGCKGHNLIEIDAATNTGIDQMRNVQETIQYKPIEGKSVGVIVDEAHGLSRQAWDSLLKTTEEPPDYVYWFFCTTQPEKMPKTLLTRCMHFALKELDRNTLTDLVTAIAVEEGLELVPEVRQVIVSQANGSARQALVNMAACWEVRDRADASQLLQSVEDSDEVLALLRMLANGKGTWPQAMKLLEGLNGANPESIRIQALNYFAACARRARNDREASYYLDLMDGFSKSYAGFEAKAQLLISIGRCMFSEGSKSD